MALIARVRACVVALVVLVPAIARAQATPDAGVAPTDADADAAPAAPPSFEPPKALGGTEVPYPPNAPTHTAPIVVTVKLLVDVTGAVQKVELQTASQPVFDDAVLAATQQFHFEPATFGGKPVPVEITFTHTFLPPPPPPPPTPVDEGPPATAILRGKLVELGTRLPVTSATINVEVNGRRYTTDGDAHGRFQLPIPPGVAKISVYAPAHLMFAQQETLADKQALSVAYLVERDRYDPYEIVVVSDQRREEVSRITLKGAELKEVPGTFGDPFRVIQALPGVASVVSLLPFPVVRGASPSSTGYMLDGTEIPLLYHLLAGPSVIHPDFIDEIQFYPGGAPVLYGGYDGGIIDGTTVRARSDEHLIDVDVNLLEAGGLVREPIPQIGATMTAAARYGFPGFLLSLATNQLSLSYWDYQLRLDGGTPRNGWTVFAYGARDELDTVASTADPNDPNPPLTPTLILGFHRLDIRDHQTDGNVEETARVVGGYDRSLSNGVDFTELRVDPSIRLRWKADPTVTFNAGVDGSFMHVSQDAGANTAENPFAAITATLDNFYTADVFTEAIWRPTPRWLIRPGIRADLDADDVTTKYSADPRISARYKIADRDLPDLVPGSDDSAIWIKASSGIFHEPPRFVLPVPGLDMLPLKYGLSRAIQNSLGAEVPLAERFQLTAEGFFNYMDPTIFDLSTNAESVGTGANTSLVPTSVVVPTTEVQQLIQRLTTPELGRAYGLELMLRRQAKSGIFGWISYTLSRSERQINGTWAPYDYDRTQLVNIVAGLPLPRNWDFGVRMQYESGLPETTTAGYNTARADGYLRFDVRVDKRAVYRKWLLDFYVDITNIAVLPEEVTPGVVIRYVLPTVGLRGRF